MTSWLRSWVFDVPSLGFDCDIYSFNSTPMLYFRAFRNENVCVSGYLTYAPSASGQQKHWHAEHHVQNVGSGDGLQGAHVATGIGKQESVLRKKYTRA